MRGYSFEGVIIKRQNFGETDKLVTFFTREKGKITLKANGIRKINSKRSGSLDLFNQVKAVAVPGKGSLDILTEVQAVNSFSSWKGHLGRVNLAYQVCEVIDKLTADAQPHYRVYEQLVEFLISIPKLDSGWKKQLDSWLVKLISELGFWPTGTEFTDDIFTYIESLAGRKINSPKVLKKLSSSIHLS